MAYSRRAAAVLGLSLVPICDSTLEHFTHLDRLIYKTIKMNYKQTFNFHSFYFIYHSFQRLGNSDNGNKEVEFMEAFWLLILKAGKGKDLRLRFVFDANLNGRKSPFHFFAASNAYIRNMKFSSV